MNKPYSNSNFFVINRLKYPFQLSLHIPAEKDRPKLVDTQSVWILAMENEFQDEILASQNWEYEFWCQRRKQIFDVCKAWNSSRPRCVWWPHYAFPLIAEFVDADQAVCPPYTRITSEMLALPCYRSYGITDIDGGGIACTTCIHSPLNYVSSLIYMTEDDMWDHVVSTMHKKGLAICSKKNIDNNKKKNNSETKPVFPTRSNSVPIKKPE